MQNSYKLFFLLFFIGFSIISAQQSTINTYNSKEFDQAMLLYKDTQYASSQMLLGKVRLVTVDDELKSDCSFYIASCAMRTSQANAAILMERFVVDYPTSRKQNNAYVALAQYYFEQDNYSQALEWFEKAGENNLNDSEREKFNFQKGYSFFVAKNKKEATNCFNKIINSAEYGSRANYYLGFMAYESDNYTQAAKYFGGVSGEEKYKEKLSYYQADMNFKLGNFQKAVDLGIKAIVKSNEFEQSELNKIIGESYFNLQQYAKSIPYLVLYKGKNGKWNNTDFYQLGYAYYMQKDFGNAISQFNKIIAGNDSVAQNAYYHLGESYLNLNKKQQALNAFKNASEMDFEPAIKEDASLNYAKLSYEIGNAYTSTPTILNSFLLKYPNNANKSEIEKLLIDSYISSKNYQEALILLEKGLLQENRLAYQKVSFFRGLELFADEKYVEAATLFEKSLAQQQEERFTARATFWKGETEYLLADFKNAALSYKQFQGLATAKETSEFKNIAYNIAYSYFKLKEYDQAANYFQNQIDNARIDKIRLYDSYLRLADCRFVTSKYSAALEAYNKVIEFKSIDADYAYFQKAICYGFVSKNDKKIEELNAFLKLYPKSDYRDDAYFELGNTYVAENKQDFAISTYEKLNSEFKSGSFTAKALLRQGLIYYNSDEDDLAIVKFKKVAADFPKTVEALEAVSTARLIYVDKGRVEEYASWVRTLDFVSITDAELDNDTYEAAEKQYLQNNNKQAILGLSAYVNKFPKGIHSLKANFYLAQLYYSDAQEPKSIPNYSYVIEQARSEFMELSLYRLAQIFLKNDNKAQAIAVLTRLENEADISLNKLFAQSNLMKLYYNDKDYTKAVVYADKVLSNPKTDDNVKSDAQIIIARAAIQTGDETKARLAYTKLQTIAAGELAAEALYYEAFFKNKDLKYEDSNSIIQKLAKNYSSYKYFGAKGLILMAKNFYNLKDGFQATYILNSVIKNFNDFTDVVAEAQTELDKIKKEHANTNSSIQN